MTESTFETIFEEAKKYKYSSMNYIDFDDCRNAIVLHNNDDLILLRDDSAKNMLYFAANDFSPLAKIIASMPGKMRLHFVPKEFAKELSEIGFTPWAEFIDLWNTDLVKTSESFNDEHEVEYLDKDKCEEIVTVTKKCSLQSRGF